jgi:hypothetical protein
MRTNRTSLLCVYFLQFDKTIETKILLGSTEELRLNNYPFLPEHREVKWCRILY